MIIQTAAPTTPHFVIEQADHARTAGQIARAFGNERFAAASPADLVQYIITYHDEGWVSVDALCEQSPATGLPHHLTQTPLPYVLITSKGSPDFNEQRHPLCGILSSMHTYGLYNGRYGLSDFIFIDRVPEEYKPAMLAMLQSELDRQARLKQLLPAEWSDEPALFTQYKLLQFCDTLALYFQLTHQAARMESKFLNVPDGTGSDHTLEISPLPNGDYTLTPWPFLPPELILTTAGRYLTPQPQGTDFQKIFADTAKTKQTHRLVKRET